MQTNDNMTPREIVGELDKYIIGQEDAKKSVAIALRNRYRRLQLDEEMQKEITPKNILMIGPTGVGKTEIARRLADIVNAPFIKVEATKFTEVGYIGRDVESMVRDLVEAAIKIIREEREKDIRPKARRNAINRIAQALVPAEKKKKNSQMDNSPFASMFESMGVSPDQFIPEAEKEEDITPEIKEKREETVQKIKTGELDEHEVTIDLEEKKTNAVGPMNAGLEQMGIDLGSTLSALQPKKIIEQTLKVKNAVEILTDEEAVNMVKVEDFQTEAIKLAENSGIIFLDEIDKITSQSENSGEVSREGVQRDILPIVEGSSVNTKYGVVNTDHMLFIGSGAFSHSKPSDLMPELQGRFPIRVELDDLTAEDFYRILTEPHNALIKQYQAMLKTENITIVFTKEAIEHISNISFQVNTETENIGARRLHTILEKLLEELLFEAPDMQMGEVQITEAYVDDKVGDIAEDNDLSRYIL